MGSFFLLSLRMAILSLRRTLLPNITGEGEKQTLVMKVTCTNHEPRGDSICLLGISKGVLLLGIPHYYNRVISRCPPIKSTIINYLQGNH